MSVVKGSKQYQVKVVSYRPLYRALVWLVGAALVAGALLGSYVVGNYQGVALQAQAAAERDQLRIDLQAKTRELQENRQRVANLALGSEVDRKASEEVRTEVIDLKAQIAALQADISFYRGLMAPTGNKRGLTIGSLDVIATGAPREFRYKLVMQQLSTDHKMLSGTMSFNVVGRQLGVLGQPDTPMILPLKDLTDSVSSDKLKLRFKYFQNFVGRLTLPVGFEPQRIELLAKSTGKKAVTVEKNFGWLVQEG